LVARLRREGFDRLADAVMAGRISAKSAACELGWRTRPAALGTGNPHAAKRRAWVVAALHREGCFEARPVDEVQSTASTSTEARSPATPSEALQAALEHAADCLAALPQDEFDALAREEASDLPVVYEYFESAGWPEMFPPERVLGHRILEIFAAKYPHLADGDVGTA
jgi:hypothetical protein